MFHPALSRWPAFFCTISLRDCPFGVQRRAACTEFIEGPLWSATADWLTKRAATAFITRRREGHGAFPGRSRPRFTPLWRPATPYKSGPAWRIGISRPGDNGSISAPFPNPRPEQPKRGDEEPVHRGMGARDAESSATANRASGRSRHWSQAGEKRCH